MEARLDHSAIQRLPIQHSAIQHSALFFMVCALASCSALWGQSNADADFDAFTAERYALVIGNKDYPAEEQQLVNPHNDAKDMKKALTRLGFEIELLLDVDKSEINAAVAQFRRKLPANSIALFYYAGHGIQNENDDFIVPVDAYSGSDEEDHVPLASVLDELKKAASAVNIVILDTCRLRNPYGAGPATRRARKTLKRAITRGFEPTQWPEAGTIVAYAASPGGAARDDGGRNGVFTGALLREIGKVDLDIESIFKNARKTVHRESKGRQIPLVETTLINDVVLYQSPAKCVDLLKADNGTAIRSDLTLGRVHFENRTMEPVLIWEDPKNKDQPYQFRHCSAEGTASNISVSAADMELFSDSLVAYFDEKRIDSLITHRELPGGLGYQPSGLADFDFNGIGSMLEARRLGEGHVEIMGTDRLRIIPRDEATQESRKVPVLLVASRASLAEVDLSIWDEAWGEKPEDRLVEREIHWWELANNTVHVHAPTSDFDRLSQQVEQPSEPSSTIPTAELRKHLEEVLDRVAYSMIVVESEEHIRIAETMNEAASTTGSPTDLDIATLEKNWKNKTHQRLEEIANKGRYLPLLRTYDLAAIMPGRIAGKIRRHYYRNAIQVSAITTTRFVKEPVMLDAGFESIQVGYGLYQDQAAGMATLLSFFDCLLKQDYTKEDRRKTLIDGFRELNIRVEDLETMNVYEAFSYLFQGFSLAPGLKAGERHFLNSISRGDSHVSELIQQWQSYLASTTLNPAKTCDVVLVSEDRSEPLRIVRSLPTEVGGNQIVDNQRAEEEAAQKLREDKAKARRALRDAIYAMGARHTKKDILKGYKHLDAGNYDKAEAIFIKAKETAFRIVHSKPNIKVH